MQNFKDAAKELAQQFNLDESSVECLLKYAMIKLENDEIRSFFLINPEEGMKMIVENWKKASEKFFTNALKEDSEERKFIVDELYKIC